MATRQFTVMMTLVGILMTASVALAQDGRWKAGGDGSCYFDQSDSGPDQCSPGRWKAGGDGSCYWDTSDSGPAQCDPNAPVRVEAVETLGGTVDQGVVDRLVNAASQMQAWGITESNVSPDTLPLIAQALADNGFADIPLDVRSFGGGLGGGGSVMSCAELYAKAAQWEAFARGLQRVSYLYGGGIIVMSRMPGPAAWWATSVLAVGTFVTAVGSAQANWIAQDMRRQTCAA